MRLMKRVARRVALSLSESKRYSVVNQLVFANSGTASQHWRYKNIFAQLPVATGSTAGSSYGLEGNEVVDLMVKAKINFVVDFGAILNQSLAQGYGTIFLHIYLISCNDFSGTSVSGAPPPNSVLWNTVPPQYTADDNGWFLVQNGQNPTLNGNNVRVIRAWHKRYTPEVQYQQFATGDSNRVGYGRLWQTLNVKHKFRGKKTFEDNPYGDNDPNFPRAGILNGKNYYWLIGWGSSSNISTAAAQPNVYMDEFLYFKDP